MNMNPDAQADKELICQTIDEYLVPTFKLLGEMLSAIEKKADSANQQCTLIIDTMHDAMTGYRQNDFQTNLLPKFQPDLDSLDSFYSDTQGNKFSDQLIQELLSTEIDNPEEYVSSKINNAKGKYGKYLGIGVTVAPTGESPAVESAEPAAEEAGESAPEETAEMPAPKKSKKPSFKDMTDSLGLMRNSA